MERVRLIVGGTSGLHARPAAEFVQSAKRFASKIDVIAGERQADAKSILGILTLNIGAGAVIDLCAEGDDERHAISVLRELLESGPTLPA